MNIWAAVTVAITLSGRCCMVSWGWGDPKKSRGEADQGKHNQLYYFSKLPLVQSFTSPLFVHQLFYRMHCCGTVDFVFLTLCLIVITVTFSTRKKKDQNTRNLNRINNSFEHSVFCSITQKLVAQNETLATENFGFVAYSGKITLGQRSVCHFQIIERKIADSIRKEVAGFVATVGSWVHDAVLTVMDNVVITRVEKTVTSITGTPARGRNRLVQNLDFKVFFR